MSPARVTIELAFGVLIGQWGILWRKLPVPVDKAAQIVLVYSKLHKFIIERGKSANVPASESWDVYGLLMELHAQDEFVKDEKGRRRYLETSDRRENLTRNMQKL